MILQEVWTLCRIFKRTPSYKKYTPNWKEASATKRNHNDSSSKTCSSSLESENSSEQYMGFGDSFHPQQNESKPFIINHVEDRNHLFMSQFNPLVQSPYSASYSSFWNSNGDDFFTNGNWDELRSVVELAADPPQSHNVYDCR